MTCLSYLQSEDWLAQTPGDPIKVTLAKHMKESTVLQFPCLAYTVYNFMFCKHN